MVTSCPLSFRFPGIWEIAIRLDAFMVYPVADIYTDSRAEERCGEKQMREDVLNTQHGKDQTGGTDP